MKRILREFIIVFYPILAILIYTFGEYMLDGSLDKGGILSFFKIVLMTVIFFLVFIYFMYIFFVKNESYSRTGVYIGIVEIVLFFFPWLINKLPIFSCISEKTLYINCNFSFSRKESK